MAEVPSSSTPPTLEVGIISFVTVAFNVFLAPKHHTLATSLAPAIGGAIGYGFRWLRRRHNYNTLVDLGERAIAKWDNELKKPGTSPERKAELRAKVESKEADLQKLRTDRYRVE